MLINFLRRCHTVISSPTVMEMLVPTAIALFLLWAYPLFNIDVIVVLIILIAMLVYIISIQLRFRRSAINNKYFTACKTDFDGTYTINQKWRPEKPAGCPKTALFKEIKNTMYNSHIGISKPVKCRAITHSVMITILMCNPQCFSDVEIKYAYTGKTSRYAKAIQNSFCLNECKGRESCNFDKGRKRFYKVTFTYKKPQEFGKKLLGNKEERLKILSYLESL